MKFSWLSGAKMSALTGIALAALAFNGCADDDDPDPEGDCAVNKDCPGEQVCDDNNECVDPGTDPECTNNHQCDGDDVCNDDGVCVDPGGSGDLCEENDDCEGDEVCNENGECVDDPGTEPECTNNEQCDGEEICNEDGECVDPGGSGDLCEDDEDCDGEEVCNEEGVCVDDPGTEPECIDNDDCDGDDVCSEEGECVDPGGSGDLCEENDDCEGDEVCNEDGECVEDPGTEPECEEDVDCEEGEFCSDENTCEIVTVDTDYRWTSLAIQEPDVYVKALDPDCEESQLDGLLNDTLEDMVGDPELDPEDEDDEYPLDYDLSINQQLPIPVPENGSVEGQLTVPECILDENENKICEEPEDMPTSDWLFSRATTNGACFARVPEEANAEGWIDNPELEIDASLIPTNDDGNCIIGESEGSFDLELMILGLAQVDIILNGAHMAFELDEATGEVRNGMLAGFLTHEDADQDVLGLLNVQDIFNSGSAESCKDDVPLDSGPDADGNIVDGWWLYIAFEGDDMVSFAD